jgi:N-acetylglutamate synthase-like GNAT family acetyltransferase
VGEPPDEGVAGLRIPHFSARPLPRCSSVGAVVDVRVRRAGPSDVAVIEHIVHAAFDIYVARIGRQPAPMSADYRAAVASSRVWVIDADGEVAGVVVNKVHDDYLLLDTVAVAPGAQGHGYGALLLARAGDDARELGLAEVRLVTNQAMTENQTFYPRLGYIETARGRQDGYDRVFYAKHVAAQ